MSVPNQLKDGVGNIGGIIATNHWTRDINTRMYVCLTVLPISILLLG